MWDQDVHLGALGADDVAVQRVFAQVHLATIGLVDGDGRDSSQRLEMTNTVRPCKVCALDEIVPNYRSQDATVFLCPVDPSKAFDRINHEEFVLYVSPRGASQNILRKKE